MLEIELNICFLLEQDLTWRECGIFYFFTPPAEIFKLEDAKKGDQRRGKSCKDTMWLYSLLSFASRDGKTE